MKKLKIKIGKMVIEAEDLPWWTIPLGLVARFFAAFAKTKGWI